MAEPAGPDDQPHQDGPVAPPHADDAPAEPEAPRKNPLQPLLTFHRDHPVYFWLALTGVVTAVLVVGAVVSPSVVVDNFLWNDFWGPTVADATQEGRATYNDVTVSEDYTLLSELIYGIILAGALVSLYIHLFRKRAIEVDGRFIGSMLPYILFGPLARTMEDTSVFCSSGTEAVRSCDPGIFSYVFISPFIYMLTAAAVITHLLLAHATRAADEKVRYQVVGGWLLAQAASYAFIFYGFQSEFTVLLTPWTVLGLCVLAFVVYGAAMRRGGRHETWAVVSWGLPMTLMPVVLIVQWERGLEWVSHGKVDPFGAFVEHPEAPGVIPLVLGLTLAVVLVIMALSFLLRRDAPGFASFLTPLNIGIIGGHMLDGFATFTAVCSQGASQLCSGATIFNQSTFGYGEKHPVSEFFLGFADGWGFPLMKLLLVTVIIVLIDRSARSGDEDPSLVGLVKMAVLILGLAPGVRDLARVAMGV